MSSMLVASVAASTSSTKGSPKHRDMSVVEENGVLDRENLLQRENLAKSQEERASHYRLGTVYLRANSPAG